MTRLHGYTIPSKFIRLDDTVSDPDAFYNVRDQQVLRRNHNILLARRVKKNIGSFATQYVQGTWSTLPATRAGGYVLAVLPLYFSPWVKEISVYIYAQRFNAAWPAYVYPVIDGQNFNGEIDPNTWVNITASGGTYGLHSVDVPVPNECHETGHGTLTLYMAGYIGNTDLLNPGGPYSTLITVQPRYVEIDTTPAGGPVPTRDTSMYCKTDAEVSPRWITAVDAMGGNQYRLHLERPLNKLPVVNTDTIETQQQQGIFLRGLSINENQLSDFGTNPGVF